MSKALAELHTSLQEITNNSDSLMPLESLSVACETWIRRLGTTIEQEEIEQRTRLFSAMVSIYFLLKMTRGLARQITTNNHAEVEVSQLLIDQDLLKSLSHFALCALHTTDDALSKLEQSILLWKENQEKMIRQFPATSPVSKVIGVAEINPILLENLPRALVHAKKRQTLYLVDQIRAEMRRDQHSRVEIVGVISSGAVIAAVLVELLKKLNQTVPSTVILSVAVPSSSRLEDAHYTPPKGDTPQSVYVVDDETISGWPYSSIYSVVGAVLNEYGEMGHKCTEFALSEGGEFPVVPIHIE